MGGGGCSGWMGGLLRRNEWRLAEVRVPPRGDELVEAYYHRTVW